jgi:hypothetical protein
MRGFRRPLCLVVWLVQTGGRVENWGVVLLLLFDPPGHQELSNKFSLASMQRNQSDSGGTNRPLFRLEAADSSTGLLAAQCKYSEYKQRPFFPTAGTIESFPFSCTADIGPLPLVVPRFILFHSLRFNSGRGRPQNELRKMRKPTQFPM